MDTPIAVAIRTRNGTCAACRGKERPLWEANGKLLCASCTVRELTGRGGQSVQFDA